MEYATDACWASPPHDWMCSARIPVEVLAYQGYAGWAWSVLPISALLELAGITAFAINISGTFILEPSHVQKQPLVVGVDSLRSYSYFEGGVSHER